MKLKGKTVVVSGGGIDGPAIEIEKANRLARDA
jgi:hypothetical protein